MELSSNLKEKLLDKENIETKENEKYKFNKIENLGNFRTILNNKKYEEIDTDQFDDIKKSLLNKKDKKGKKIRFVKHMTKEDKKTKKKLKPKMINHFFLAIFTVIQSLLILNPITTIMRAQERIFYNIFLENSTKEVENYNKVLYLYDLDQLRDHFKKTINNFFNIEKFLLNRVGLFRNYTVVEFFYFEDKYMDNLNRQLFLKNESLYDKKNIHYDPFPDLDVYQDKENSEKFINNKDTNYKITDKKFGPFDLDNQSLKLFLNDVKYFRVHFSFHIFTVDEYTGLEKCDEWSIYQRYNFKSRSYFISDLDFSVKSCSKICPLSKFESLLSEGIGVSNQNIIDSSAKLNRFLNELTWIHLIIIILASYSMYNCLMYVTKFSFKFMDEKEKRKKLNRRTAIRILNQEKKSEDSSHESEFYNPLFSSCSEGNEQKENNKSNFNNPKNKFKNFSNKKVFNFWNILCLISNLIQIIASGYSLTFIHNPPYSVNFLIGLGCMLSLVNIARYIPFSTDYAIIYETLNISFPMVIRYISGVLPMYIGFILFGYCLFWESERFSSISSTMRTLFSMINGDSVYSTFEDLKRDNFFISQIYLYIFNISFLIIFLNIFISIIEESYVVAKIQNKTSFIYKYLRIDSKLVNPKIKSKKSLVVTENFFKEKAKEEEERFNDTRMQISDDLSYNQLFQKKYIIGLLDEEKSSFSDNKFIFPYNIVNDTKPDSINNLENDKEYESNIIFINKHSSENTSKNQKNTINSEKYKRNTIKKDLNLYTNDNNIDELENIENQKFNESNHKSDSNNNISISKNNLDNDSILLDEDNFTEKFKDIENSYDKIEFIIEKISGLSKDDKEYISDFTLKNVKIVNDKLHKIKELWMKSSNLLDYSAS